MTTPLRGLLTVDEATSLIATDSAALRAAARIDFAARIVAAPDWTMADLLWHIGRVHWFWRTVVTVPIADAQELEAYPDIERPADDELLAFAAEQAAAMVDAFRRTDPSSPNWTWSPAQQDCGFVIRHQVQEAAVHRWDAQRAVGTPAPIDRHAALDAVDEFLTASLASPAWPADGAEPLGVPLVLDATDGDVRAGTWTVTDTGPGVVAATPGAPSAAAAAVTVRGTASELLLWLYERVDDLTVDGPAAASAVARFRAFTSTD